MPKLRILIGECLYPSHTLCNRLHAGGYSSSVILSADSRGVCSLKRHASPGNVSNAVFAMAGLRGLPVTGLGVTWACEVELSGFQNPPKPLGCP